MGWIVSSINIPSMHFNRYENWYYRSDKESELFDKKILIEGDFYYHEHLFINEVLSFPDTVDGSYAIALFHDRFILCASDSVCTRNIYYYIDRGFYCVSSSLNLILNTISNYTKITLDSAFLYTYLIYGHKQYRTPYNRIHKLPAGWCIKITDSVNIFPYFNYDAELKNAIKIVEGKDRAEYAIEILMSHCKSIVEKSIGGTILTQISGGVDSSLLTGLLHEATNGKDVIVNGYSYTYQDQKIGNELRYMKDVAEKNKIHNHIITNLELDSIRISRQHNIGFPDMSSLNNGLFCRTYDAVISADITVSGQGGDICIGDYYSAFADNDSIWISAYRDSMYCEKFILWTLIEKYVYPMYLGNIIPYQHLCEGRCYPIWITMKMQHTANQTLNQAYSFIHKNAKDYSLRIALFDYLEYNGLVSDDVLPYVCYFPFFSRDMVIFGRLFNDCYAKKGTYRQKIKSAARKYLPLSVYLRNGKSRMDTVTRQAFAKNAQVYQELASKSILLPKMSINKEHVISEMQKIIDGKNYDAKYSLRLLSLLIWYEDFCSKYPAK